MQQLKLKRLSIYATGYKNPQLQGTIEIEGQAGEVKLNLTNEQALRIISAIADELVEFARVTASGLTGELIEAFKPDVIEHQKDEDNEC